MQRAGEGGAPPIPRAASSKRLAHAATARPSLAPRPPLPLCPSAVLVLGGINPLYNFLKGQADTFSTLGLPDWLIHWVSAQGAGWRAWRCLRQCMPQYSGAVRAH